MGNLDELFGLCEEVSSAATKSIAGASGVGVFKLYNSRLIRYGESGKLVVILVQPDGEKGLKKMVAYDNSYSRLSELVKISPFSVVEITGFQTLSTDRIQLTKLSTVMVTSSDNHCFPRLAVDSFDSATSSSGVHVLKELVLKSLKPGAPFVGCLRCHYLAVKGRNNCGFCDSVEFGLHIPGSGRFESPQGHVFKCYLDAKTLSEVCGISLGAEMQTRVRFDKTLEFLQTTVKDKGLCVAISEQQSKHKVEKYYVIDSIVSPDLVKVFAPLDEPPKRTRRSR